MATSVELLGGGQMDLDSKGSGELLPLVFLVQGLAIGEDATVAPGVSVRGSDRTVGAYKFICDRVAVSKVISDTAVEVSCFYSTDGRFSFPTRDPDPESPNYREWDRTYRKDSLQIPYWRSTIQPYNGGQVAKWDLLYRPFPIESPVLSIRVKFDAGDNTGITQAMDVMDREIGKIHIFPPWPAKLWRMLAPSISSTPESLTEVFVAYSWESDSGNGNFGFGEFGRLVAATGRGPFHDYVPMPGEGLNGIPSIDVVNNYPTNSPFYNPTGWQNLPGGPI